MANENTYNENLSLDEIVFENRNKSYGAYDLRSSYRKILTRSFILGTVLFCVVAITPFVIMQIQQMTAKEKPEFEANLIEILPEETIIEQPEEDLPPPPPPPPVEEEQIEIIQNVVPEPKKAPVVETPPPPISQQLETTTGVVAQEGVKTPTYTPPPPPPSTGTKAATIEAPKVDLNKVYLEIDQMAEYPGGMSALRKFLGQNFDIEAVDGDGETLTARLRFIVERDGTVSDVKVIAKSGNSGFDNEAIRTVRKLKKWSPGKLNGQTVRSPFEVPFTMKFE